MSDPRTAPYGSVRLADVDTLEQVDPENDDINDGTFHLVRRHFDVRSFGVNAVIGNAGDEMIEEHHELDSEENRTNGHEELFAVMTGHAVFKVDGEEIDAPAGTVVFGLANDLRDALLDARLLREERPQLAAARLTTTLTLLIDRPFQCGEHMFAPYQDSTRRSVPKVCRNAALSRRSRLPARGRQVRLTAPDYTGRPHDRESRSSGDSRKVPPPEVRHVLRRVRRNPVLHRAGLRSLARHRVARPLAAPERVVFLTHRATSGARPRALHG